MAQRVTVRTGEEKMVSLPKNPFSIDHIQR